jgi:diacylglycerol O-acyltransferase / wax synthase
MQQLNPMDAQFVDAEDQDKHASFAIASIAVFEGPGPSYGEFLEAVAARLPLVPIYRRKLRTVPFRLAPPVWVDAPDFDLRYHVRHTALPFPGGRDQLNRLIARVMAQRLDRDYPLWEYWLVDGLSEGRWAVILKVHHALVDGVSGTSLYRVIFDLSPEPSPLPPAVDEPVSREPSGYSLLAVAAFDLALRTARAAAALTGAYRRPGAAVGQSTELTRAVARLASSARPAAQSSLSGSIGRQRRYTWARASLDDVKTIKNELGGTVNDVVLAAISSGFRALLQARGEEPGPHMVPSLVPVSLRGTGEENIYENRLSVVVANLPVHLADPRERLEAVRAELSALKSSREAAVGEALLALARVVPYPLASMAVRLAYGLPQHEIVTVTTNVPGPGQPLYAMGRKLVEVIPYVPIATTLRTGISIFSYCGTLTFGITGDYDSTPDLELLAHGIEEGIAELLKATEHGAPPRRKKGHRR